jgi:hypothetical protein
MAGENAEIQKRRRFNGLAGIGRSVEKQRNSSEFDGGPAVGGGHQTVKITVPRSRHFTELSVGSR